LTILSGIEADEFAICVQANDSARLTKLPGVGKKTAERLIVEMRDRLDDLPKGTVSQAGKTLALDRDDPVNDAVSALIGLGYKPPEASKYVLAVASEGMSSEELIREALKNSVKQ
jgi:Holliday junction DNA helicase RuvA